MKETNLVIRIDDKLKAEFLAACQKKNLTGSSQIRKFCKNFVARVQREEKSNVE